MLCPGAHVLTTPLLTLLMLHWLKHITCSSSKLVREGLPKNVCISRCEPLRLLVYSLSFPLGLSLSVSGMGMCCIEDQPGSQETYFFMSSLFLSMCVVTGSVFLKSKWKVLDQMIKGLTNEHIHTLPFPSSIQCGNQMCLELS